MEYWAGITPDLRMGRMHMDKTELFTDGEAYERMMGRWSRLVGETFLAWLDPPKGLRWLDVGCGNGAFTEEIFARCDPAAVVAIDPSASPSPSRGMSAFWRCCYLENTSSREP